MESINSQRILPLSAEAISQIHSSKHITSLQGVVLSLLENSLDARATKINISVDWRRGCCTVDDNGSGIPSTEFTNSGGLGKMYCTSKRAPVGSLSTSELHGSNGMFIAELAAMSLLSISSTSRAASQESSITIHQNKVLNRRIPNASALGDTGSSGTSIVVKDLFGNMPVRVKQRALTEDDQKSDDRAWQELKRGIVGLLSAWTKPCSVRLRDVNVDSRAVTISGNHPSVSDSLTEKSLHRLAGKRSASHYDLRDALPMLFQSGLAPNESRNRWVPLSASSSSISLKGLICLDPAPMKQCQFISLGIRPCNPMSGHSELHDAVNKTFNNSSFGTTEEPVDSDDITKSHGGASVASRAQVRRGLDRFPMYCIQVNITGRGSSSAGDLEQMSEASLKAIDDVLTAAVHAWLEKNNFRPRKRRKPRKEQKDSGEASSAASSRPTSAHGSLPNTPSELKSRGQGLSPTVESNQQHISKRRKVVDLSLRPSSSNGMSQIQASLALDYGMLSNIKKGRDRPRSNLERNLASPRNDEVGKSSLKTANGSENINGRPERRSLHFSTAAESIEAGALNERSIPMIAQKAASANGSHGQTVQALSSDDFGSIDDEEMIAVAEGPAEQSKILDSGGEDETLTWTDLASNQAFRVNARTGVVLPLSAGPGNEPECGPRRQRAGINTTLSSAGKPLSLTRRKVLAAEEGDESTVNNGDKWLPGFLREWNNPVFARQQEDPIPSASLFGPGLLDIDGNGRPCAHDAHGTHPLDRNALPNPGIKLSKAALQNAEIIGQVDRKFILCKLPSTTTTSNTLILVDQHAASERIILETLFSELFDPSTHTIHTTNLEHETTKAKPLHFSISSQEADLFTKYQTHFSTWGIIYTLTSAPKPEHIIKITHLPTLIAARCSTLPSLAIDLLRSELWTLADGTKKALSQLPIPHQHNTENDSSPTWLTLLPHLPTKLLEMLHSRACRSAVMFNDVLSKEECAELMGKVSKCVFPFVCAHGRVGMVPVMEFEDDENGFGMGTKEDEEGVLRGEGMCDFAVLGGWVKEQWHN